jgi:hypothetical protein
MSRNQLEDGQRRISDPRIHDPVQRHAEPLAGGLLVAKIYQRSARRPDLHHEQRRCRALGCVYLLALDDHDVRVQFGRRGKLHGRLGDNPQVAGACKAEPNRQLGLQTRERPLKV